MSKEGFKTIDGRTFKPMVRAALAWLERHQEAINALNVFPVPDGDTGTNMMLTMTSAWKEIADLDEPHIGKLAGQIAHGALMGARGNSGVILSQIWRGFARGLDGHGEMDGDLFATAMRIAAETAYKGVVRPVEGTILTVVREAAEEVEAAAEETDDLLVLFERMLERARLAESRTPMLLTVLREAGVTDSGGQGFVIILEGMVRRLKGLPVEEGETLRRVAELEAVMPPHGEEIEFDENYPYDVQFIIVGHDLNVETIRSTIEAMGDCPLVVGDAETIKVHVHVADPGVPISFGAKMGSLRDVVVEDMQAQYREFIAGREAPSPPPPSPATLPARPPQEETTIGVVAVVAGDGLADVFRSLGAGAVIEGGQTMNPSTADILEAVEALPSEEIIILPNNKNIIMAAQQAAEMSHKHVALVPTRSVPQGIAALLMLDQTTTLDENVATMLEAAQAIESGEVTYAVRDVQLNGVTVHKGDAIGLLNGQLAVSGAGYDEVVERLLEKLELDERELVTLYYGEGVEPTEAEALAERLGKRYPDLEFEVVRGGQPHYPYLIAVE